MSTCSSQQHKDPATEELDELMLTTRMERIRRKYLVLSGKGGVGKSTVAANLALALAAGGKPIGLLDADLHGPSIPTLLGVAGQRLEGASDCIEPMRITENLKLASIGLMLESPKDAVIWRGPMKYGVIRQLLKDVAWGELDALVVDSPPGTGDEPLAVAQLVGKDAQAVIVTTPQEVAVADVRRSVTFCRSLELPVAGIIENMSGFACPHCGKTVELFKTGGGERLAREMDVPFLGRIPIDPAVAASGDQGRPIVLDPSQPAAKAFAAIVQALQS